MQINAVADSLVLRGRVPRPSRQRVSLLVQHQLRDLPSQRRRVLVFRRARRRRPDDTTPMMPPRGEKCDASHSGDSVWEKNRIQLKMVPKVCARDIPSGDKDWKAAEPITGRQWLGVCCFTMKQGKKRLGASR